MSGSVDALVAEAARDAPPLPHLSQTANIARLLWAMLHVSGTMDFGRGWTKAAAGAFERAGLKAPSADILSMQKCVLLRQPERWAEHAPDPALVDDVLSRRV